MSKTGNQHLKSLRDGREVYLNGKKIPVYENVTYKISRNVRSSVDLDVVN